MTDLTERPPIIGSALVDEATKQAIADALQPIVDAQTRHDEALTSIANRLDDRSRDRAIEHELFMRRFDALDGVKALRDTQIADRPTYAEVATQISAAIATMSINVDTAITKALNPLILELAGVHCELALRLCRQA